MKSPQELEMERTQKIVRDLEQRLAQAKTDANVAWQAYVRAPDPDAQKALREYEQKPHANAPYLPEA